VEARDLTLCINAGGRGLRLGGTPKGLIRLGERTVLERLLDLEVLSGEVLLVANDDAYAAFGLRTVPDVIPDRGAPGGVVTGLLESRTPWVLVVGCDMPFVEVAAVEPLFAGARAGVDVVAYEREGRLEPLLALYRASLGPAWRAKLEHETPSLQSLLRSAALVTLTPAEPRWLDSLNTPEDVTGAGGASL